MSEVIYSWRFSDKKERGHTWYIIMLSFMIGMVIWGFLTKQYGLSFIVLLVSGVFFYVENNSEEQVQIEITDVGIKIADIFYDYAKIRSYSYLYAGQEAIFVRFIVTKWSRIRPIDVDVNNQIVTSLKRILPNFLVEDPKQELSRSDKLIRLLKL